MRKPRYDLGVAQRARLFIGRSSLSRANETLQWDDLGAVERYVLELFQSLTPGDFAHVEAMPQRSGLPRYGDVYGKANREGVWFIKFELTTTTTTTLIMSCHEPERPLELANGLTLRARRPPPRDDEP